MKTKLTLLESDFEEHWISFRVPIEIWKQLHFHPCEIEVDLTELMDKHEERGLESRTTQSLTATADSQPMRKPQEQNIIEPAAS